MQQPNTLPMSGIRVLDFSNMMAGPYCTRLLADLGAEVVKVEPPEGDHNRSRRPVRNGVSSFFGHLNCGKKSVVLDLKSKEGLEAATRLAQLSDVVVENWRPGVADRLSVGYSDISSVKPDIVYCSISGFGQTGPKALRPAYAPIVHAASGFDLAQLSYQGEKTKLPANTAIFVADLYGGLAAFGAIQTAMFDRQRTGRGRYIDVSLLDCMLNVMVNEIQEVQNPSPVKQRAYQPLRAKDGFIVVAPTSQKNFENLARALDHPEWVSDPRFIRTKIREEHWDELMRLIEGWSQSRSASECEEILLSASVPCTRYQEIGEVLKDPQVVSRQSLTLVHDAAGEYLVPNAPFQFKGQPLPAASWVSSIGEHSHEVLNALLGYSEEQVRASAGRFSKPVTLPPAMPKTRIFP